MSIEETIRKLIVEHALATEKLTEQQLVEALRQALASGDFVRNIRVDAQTQQVSYLPFRNLELHNAEIQKLRLALQQIIEFQNTHPPIVWGFANLYDRCVHCAREALQLINPC